LHRHAVFGEAADAPGSRTIDEVNLPARLLSRFSSRRRSA